jgi:hypothetical protein
MKRALTALLFGLVACTEVPVEPVYSDAASMSITGPPPTVELTGRGVVSCPFEPVLIVLTDAEPVSIRVRVTEADQGLNFAADDRPPFVNYALKRPNGSILLQGGGDDEYYFNWEATYRRGIYDVEFQWDATNSIYEDMKVNLACEYDAPHPSP